MSDVSDKVHLITAGAETVAVYATDYSVCYRLRVADVKHLPIESKRWNQDLVLCKRYTGVDGSCPKGADCWFVHADVVGIPSHPVHVNYAWRQLADVTYERLPPGYRVRVAAEPANLSCELPFSSLPSESVLRTSGSIAAAAAGRPAFLCPHYFIERVCSRGPQCPCLHSLYFDSDAKKGQRAPPLHEAPCCERLPEAIVNALRHQVRCHLAPDIGGEPCTVTSSSTCGASSMDDNASSISSSSSLCCFPHNHRPTLVERSLSHMPVESFEQHGATGRAPTKEKKSHNSLIAAAPPTKSYRHDPYAALWSQNAR